MCKDEIEDQTHVPFSRKAYEDFRKDVSWFNGSHTAAVSDVSHVMSTDDDYLRCVQFFVQCFAKEKGHCNFAN